ncbi:SEC-C metal-binding domain-containing protein [Cupriavidus sp. UYPR2.512]|uniref:SEC-C metal-binding domain-containing protein n=1 Tax=Cupriavidus sp. UYPR2.512 TaxID=1080187 RepID=UPI001E4CE343|nr:SEC-C metal-binding domain-containing protein [Cupriavidus sp. UYPR2.512]
MLATHKGRETLEARGAPVWQAWMSGGRYREAAHEVADKCADIIVFGLDIDTAQEQQSDRDDPLDLAQYPEVAALMTHIDGKLLDAIGRLWYRGKGLSAPVETVLMSPPKIRGWQRGEQLAWDEVYTCVRQDLYAFDAHVYEALDFYCPIPSCDCAEVNLHFEPVHPDGARSPGHVNVHLAGRIRLEPETHGDLTRLEQLWAAFCQRHPRYLERLSHRDTLIKATGERLVGPATAEPKVGRNDPCPCGSRKKYKKCCGA